MRFAPLVAVDSDDGLPIDASGCERLYGGFASMAGGILKDLRRLRLGERLAGAPTFGAAWALARWGPSGRVLFDAPTVESVLPTLRCS